ncbi:MAG TPA: cysteine desulfurase [Fimbriimonadaceae bacterium]|nr:cysteine desulfurase [Fimbriimonadaceae bacterium]
MSSVSQMPGLDVQQIRKDFPILQTQVNGGPLVYLDNAATSQKPVAVLNAVDSYYREANANVHRGVHYLSGKATKLFDDARENVRQFVNAVSVKEIIFTKGCSEGINLVANAFCSPANLWIARGKIAAPLNVGDVILLSQMEHHSNIVPWQLAASRTGATIKVIPMLDNGDLDLDAYQGLLNEGRVRLVGVVHVSNSLGTINPIKQMAAMAHKAGALILVDGAQAGPHLRVDVADLDADFYTLSCHKIYAPTGVGVLYGKQELLNAMPPYQGGGDMIKTVAFEQTTFADLPAKYEAGTPNISGVIGLAAAIDYLRSLAPTVDTGAVKYLSVDDAKSRVRQFQLEAATFSSPRPDRKEPLAEAFDAIGSWERELCAYATAKLKEIPGIRITGEAANKGAILAFTLEGAHPHDIGTILDSSGVAIRAGHHCCMPLMQRLGVPATARASFAFYNTKEEADALVEGVKKVKEMFSV